MDPIHISFTIPDLSLFIGFGLLVFAITTFLAISKHWEWLKNRPNPLPWMAEHYVGFLLPLGFVAIALAVYFWIWDIRGEIGQIVALLDGEKDPQNIRNLAYAIGALLAAVALSATIPFQLIKVWVNERLAKTTEQGHMTDRITKAVEQLGAEKTIWVDGDQQSVPNIEVRLGAIYALERIAQDSLRDHIPVMEILCAYVRNNSPLGNAYDVKVDYNRKNWGNLLEEEIEKIPPSLVDIQTALNVIGRRKKKHIAFERNAVVNPIKRNFRLDLRNSNLQRVDLKGFNFDFADFSHSNFQGAELKEVSMKSSSLNHTLLQGGYMNLKDAQLQKATLYFAELYNADLVSANLQGAKCIGAKFVGANLRGAKMQEATMWGVDFSGANLQKIELDKESDLHRAVFLLASVKEVDFSTAKRFSKKQAQSMFGDSTTILPKGVTPPDWATWAVDSEEFHTGWKAAKAAANL